MTSARFRPPPSETPLAQALAIAPRLAVHLADMGLDIAVWRQGRRYYEIPPLGDPVISVHVGGSGRVRYGDGDGWSRRSSTLGTVTFLPPGIFTRWLVEDGEVEHLTITTGPASRLRTVVTAAADCIEVGMPDPLNVSLAQAMIEVLAPDSADEESSALFLNSLCETLLRNFARLHRTRYRSTQAGAASTCQIADRAIRAIEERFADTLPVGQLAAEAGLSATYFSEVFKKATGVSPHQYLLRVRVERVRMALRTTDLAVAEIAQNFGFSSQSHLNAAFRKLTGLTPAQYRNQVQEPAAPEQQTLDS
jgi:AraC family transcriptional regulator